MLKIVSAIALVIATLPAATHEAEARNKGAKVAAGVVLGAAALAIIANSGRAHADERESRRDWREHCQRLYYRCSHGSNYACEKYETGGCSE
jgi:hypothetical protein